MDVQNAGGVFRKHALHKKHSRPAQGSNAKNASALNCFTKRALSGDLLALIKDRGVNLNVERESQLNLFFMTYVAGVLL